MTSFDQRSPFVGDYEDHYLVEAVRQLKEELPRPYLDREEFLYRLVINWPGGEQDHLDKALALQLLSCPRTPLGPGGIGTQSFDLTGESKALDNLKKTLGTHLPTEFSRPNERYELDFLS
ncbi:MAG: hypothetical protein GX307_05310, partial [Euryarchaeota archaeon]|nr:hypothetical protein [Euryarchaeota archaeon]